ncbi:hypothetical protein V6N13_136618 [Hibiscus sabdariffa]
MTFLSLIMWLLFVYCKTRPGPLKTLLLKDCNWNVKAQHTFHEGNIVADWLAAPFRASSVDYNGLSEPPASIT